MARDLRGRAAAGVMAVAVTVAALGAYRVVTDDDSAPLGPPARPVPTTTGGATDQASAPPDPGDHRRGGVARIAVWANPDPASPGVGGGAVRALVLPQLFVARPDGGWEASLVAPGSDVTGEAARSAALRLVDGAVWSDGAPITADDLRRTADGRFVAGVDGPAPDGTITVRFTQALPGWRRLWSGTDSIAAPRPGVWGGPYAVASVTPGLETVVVRNDRWWGKGQFLDEVRFVLVPDAYIAASLLELGRVDVLGAQAGTNGRQWYEALDGVEVATRNATGWWVGLVVNDKRVDGEGQRRALFATVDRARFVKVLLDGEAAPMQGLAGPEDPTWATVGVGDAKGVGKIVLTGTGEEPMTPVLQRAMQKRARAAGGELESRNAEHDRVEGWLSSGDYQAAIAPFYDGPVVCWSCRLGDVDAALAAAADAGDPAAIGAVEAKARDTAVLLPLWRPAPVVVWRPSAVSGVEVNGYALAPTWNAWRWWSTAT